MPYVPTKTRTDKVSSRSSFLILTLFFVFVSIIVYSTLVQVHTLYSTAPLTKVGDFLAPGSWRSQCGLFHFLPSEVVAEVQTPYDNVNKIISQLLYKATSLAYCPADSTLSVHMTKNGTLEVYRSNQVIYSLIGKSCTSILTNSLQCASGATVTETGSIEIGGQPPLQAILYDKSLTNELHSWPFGVNIVIPTPNESILPLKTNPTQNEVKVIEFPRIKIVWPWDENKTKVKGTKEGFRLPWENVKITWPWEKK